MTNIRLETITSMQCCGAGAGAVTEPVFSRSREKMLVLTSARSDSGTTILHLLLNFEAQFILYDSKGTL